MTNRQTIIKLKLVITGEIFNIVSPYASQSGETEKIKENFFERLGRSDVESAGNREDCSRS